MKKKWKLVLCLLLAVILVAGGVTLWLVNRTPPDTDPEAPFVDLSDREKEKVLETVSEYWAYERDLENNPAVWWYGEKRPHQEQPIDKDNYIYGVQYYGTFGGYYIILCPWSSATGMPYQVRIGGYDFTYTDGFWLLAYRDGQTVPLSEVYEEGLISEEQLGKIHQCYEIYINEIYSRLESYPNYNFLDLRDATKEKILNKLEKKLEHLNYDAFWYGDGAGLKYGENAQYVSGVRYYGTFGGYIVIMVPIYDSQEKVAEKQLQLGDYSFSYIQPFYLFAYKTGNLEFLPDAYHNGLLNDEQIERIYACYEWYNGEVYKWNKNEIES